MLMQNYRIRVQSRELVTTIPRYAAVTSFGSLADSGVPAHENHIIGVTEGKLEPGAWGEATCTGILFDKDWTWTPGAALFLNGIALSEIPPGVGFVQQVGLALTAQHIFINIQSSGGSSAIAYSGNPAEYLDGTGAFTVPPVGLGDVVGPAAATDKAIARYDGVTGKLLQDSLPIVEDDGRISALTDPNDLGDATNKGYVDAAIAAVSSGSGASQTTFLVSGGQVVWESAYQFRVSAAVYYIMGVLYHSAEQVVVLDPADATHDRLDVIAVDDTQTVVKITGVPAAQPSEPDVDPGSQVKLAIVLVSAGTAAPPGVATTLVYDENAGPPTEWAWASSGAGWNLASAVSPYAGLVSIEATNVSSGAYIEGVAAAPFDPNSEDLLVIFIKSKASIAANRNFVLTLRSGGVVVGASVTIAHGAWGFDSATVATYQMLAIPSSTFSVPVGSVIDRMRLTRNGPGQIGMFFDNIVWQSGGGSTPPPGGMTKTEADALYAPLVHAVRHQSGGGDPLAIDTLAAASDNTNLNATAAAHGLLPKLSGNAAEMLSGAGTWITPAGGGDVAGPAGAIDSNLAAFDGVTGKLLKDSGAASANVPGTDEKAALAGTDGTPDGTNKYVTNSDGRLTNDRNPTAHALSHKTGGGDSIKLDEFATPDDNTNLNATTTYHGLLPKLSGVASEYLDGGGGWSTPPSGGSPPTGTGFRHVTAGVEDAAAKLVENADVHAAAAIAESKLNLNHATHSNANDPSAGEKAALAGTDGTPGALNKYVTDSDGRLSDDRNPAAHAISHKSGGGDFIRLDELAATTDVTTLNATAAAHGLLPKLSGNATDFLTGTGTWSAPAGGGDVVGPASAVDDNIATFDGITGKLIQDSGVAVASVPSSDEKAALAGTHGTPSALNKYVTDSDARLVAATHKRGVMIALVCAYTPLATGADRGEVPVPYSPADGTTTLTWNVRRITLRVETAGGAPSVRIEKSTVAGAFGPATVGDVTLGDGDYQGSETAGLGQVTSGNKLRMNVLALGTAQYWTVTIELGEN
jgi:hypothetical protein